MSKTDLETAIQIGKAASDVALILGIFRSEPETYNEFHTLPPIVQKWIKSKVSEAKRLHMDLPQEVKDYKPKLGMCIANLEILINLQSK